MRGLLAALIAGLVLVPFAASETPAQIVAFLNHQRVTNGIPGQITLNPAWTTGCEHHVRYEELNGITWTHEETAGKPGFTKDGQLAGLSGDQSYTFGFETGTNPYENLPTHLIDLMAPSLQQIGAWQDGRRVCIQVSGGYTRQFTKNQVFVYPGPAHTGVPTSQTVHGEFPMSPGDAVGLPQGTTHGPTIYVMSAGPWIAEQPLHLTSAHMRGPGGSVSIRLVDPTRHPKLRYYVAPGAFFVIPVSPLSANTTYTVTVVVRSKAGTSLTKTWSFRTG